MLLHEPFFQTFSLRHQGISRFIQSVSVVPTFKLFVPRNRSSKKIPRPRGPLHQAPAPSRTVIWCNSVPRGNREARPDMPECTITFVFSLYRQSSTANFLFASESLYLSWNKVIETILNSDLYRLCGSLHGLDTFRARGLSWINKETTTTNLSKKDHDSNENFNDLFTT